MSLTPTYKIENGPSALSTEEYAIAIEERFLPPSLLVPRSPTGLPELANWMPPFERPILLPTAASSCFEGLNTGVIGLVKASPAPSIHVTASRLKAVAGAGQARLCAEGGFHYLPTSGVSHAISMS